MDGLSRSSKAAVGVAPLLAVLWAAAPIAADELVLLRDGTSRRGEVASCNPQGCEIDSRRTRRALIAAIVFDGSAKSEVKAASLLRTDETRLRDGKVVRAPIRRITGTEIMTDAGDYDRETVSVVSFSQTELDAQPEILSDVLVLRDGQRKEGSIELCSAGSCLLDRTSTLREKIEWIGLGRGDAAVPQSDRNTIHLVNGEVVERELISITDEVLTTSARYKREEVAWIHLAPVQEEEPPINRFPPPPPSGPTGPPPPPPPPPSRSSPTPPSRGGVGTGDPCPASRPMGGYVELTQSGPDLYSAPDCLHRKESRMWFRLVPMPPVLPWPARWTNTFYAPSVHYRATMGPCRVTNPDGVTCTNAGGDARHDVDLGLMAANGSITFLPLYGQLRVSVEDVDLPTETRCVGASSSGSSDNVWDNETLSIEASYCADGSYPFGFCSNVIPCTDTPTAADCIREPHKFVTFPWEGSASVNGTGPRINTSVRWKVCCGCGEPPEGGMDAIDRDPPDDPCDEIANLERRLAQLRDARAQFARDLMAAQYRQKTVLLEKILSGQGTVAQTLLALISLLANGTRVDAVGDAIGTFLDGNSVGDDPSGENIAAAVVGATGTEVVFDVIGQGDVTNAAREASEYLARTTDAEGAVRKLGESFERSAALRNKAKTFTEALGVLVAAKGLYDQGSALGDSLQDYFDAGDDVRTNQSGLDDADNQILDVELELERLKRELEDPCATTSRFGEPFPFPTLSTSDTRPRLVRYPPSMSTPPSATEAAQLTGEIAEAKRLLSEGEAQMQSAVPLMLFFASPEARAAASPELIVAVATELRKRTQAANASFRRAGEITQRIADEMRQQNPAALPTPTTAP